MNCILMHKNCYSLKSLLKFLVKSTKSKYLILLLAAAFVINSKLFAQQGNNKVAFFGLGRAVLQQTQLSGKALDSDTSNAKQANSGNTLIDVGLNVKPNANTQINLIFRAKNEFGGFYGSGATVNVRQLFVKGAIAKKINYKIGDIDLKQSRYTLWNYDEEGRVNESTALSMLRDVVYYENFYNKNNEWRVQGAQTDFAFSIKNIIQKWNSQAYIARIKVASSAPEMLINGVSTTIDQSKFLTLGLNYANTFEVAKTSSEPSTFRNPVFTVTGSTKLQTDKIEAKLFTEFGQSTLEYINTTVPVNLKQGGMMEVGASIDLKKIGLVASASFRSVSSDFFSAGAQSKRINFNQSASLFPTIGNDFATRETNLWDLSRDTRLYNRNLSQRLMNYNPRYANTLAYGDATPNRQGAVFNINYKHKSEIVDAFLQANFLSNIKGEGALEAKNYQLIKTGANVNIDKILESTRVFKLSLGFGMDKASRNGDTITSVDYLSNIIDAGVDAEILKNTEILLGIKTIKAKGKEYIPVRSGYNQIENFTLLKDDHKETILAIGLKYKFTKNIFVALQHHYVKVDDFGKDYKINQSFILFNLIY